MPTKTSNEKERSNKQERERIIRCVRFLGRCEGIGYKAHWGEMRSVEGGRKRICANVNKRVSLAVRGGALNKITHAKHLA